MAETLVQWGRDPDLLLACHFISSVYPVPTTEAVYSYVKWQEQYQLGLSQRYVKALGDRGKCSLNGNTESFSEYLSRYVFTCSGSHV